MTVITVNGNTYSDDGSTPKDMNDGGSADWFFPMVKDTMTDTAGKVASTAANALAAANSAAAAIAAPGTTATSSTAVANGRGTKNFVIQTGKSLVPGMWMTIARTSAPSTTWMNGSITSYNSVTGSLSVAITRFAGSQVTYPDWTLTLSAPGARDAGNSLQSSAQHSVDPQSDPRYQTMGPSGPSQGFLVGAFSNATAGPDLLVLQNFPAGYGHDVAVNIPGSRIGYMGPGKNMRVHGVNTVVEITGGRPYGTEMLGRLAFSSVVAGTSGLYIKSVKLDSGNELLLVHGASLHAVVVGADGTFGTPLLIRASMSVAGEDATVAAAPLHNGADDVLIASCPAGTTALQTVVLQISGLGLTLGGVTPTTLATAAVRIVDLLPLGTLATGFAIGLMISTTSLATYGVLLTGTTVSVGAILSTATVGAWAAMLPVPATPDTFIVLTTSASVLTAKPVTLTPGATTLTPGTSATTTITSNAGLAVRYDSVNALWAVSMTNTTAKVCRLSISSATAAFSGQLTVQTLIATINTFAAGSIAYDLAGANYQVALSGTDSSGRFLTEMTSVSFPGGTPTAAATATAYMAAAHTPAYLMGRQWQLASATDVMLFNPDNAIDEWRMPGMATYSQALAVNDPLYPKVSKARSTLRSGARAMSVLDGTKCSLQYDCVGGYAEATSGPVRFINTPLNYTNLSDESDVLWAASGSAPSTNITLQKLRLA